MLYNINMKKLVFYVEYLYYLPHFLPIGDFFQKNNWNVLYIFQEKPNISDLARIKYKVGIDILFREKSDIIFFANHFQEIEKLNATTCFLDHGVGTKYCDYKMALKLFDIIFVEGNYRYNQLINDYPLDKNRIYKVGFSKLDSVINISDKEKQFYIKKYSIDTTKPTLLYAPTFYPSSIEKMSKTFPDDFKNFNIIIKPHYFSLTLSKYKKQRKLFKIWEQYSNCIVCDISEYSLLPFLYLCDIMISDESSAIFEFTALDKPVILNRFLKLRLSYILNPNKLNKRIDQNIKIYRQIGDNATNYHEMVDMVYDNYLNKNKYKDVRKKFSIDICGLVDGKVSNRIFNIIQTLYQ